MPKPRGTRLSGGGRKAGILRPGGSLKVKRPKVKMPRRKPKLKGLPAPKRNLPVSKRPPLPASTKKLRTSVKVAGGAAAAGAAGAGAYKVRKRRQAKKAARGVK